MCHLTGETFNTLSAGFPDVAVHDLDVHPSGTLVIGTHGRSMYTADIRQIRLLTPEVLASGLHIFEVPQRKYNRNWGKNRHTTRPKTLNYPSGFTPTRPEMLTGR
jgi:hypothetical protein